MLNEDGLLIETTGRQIDKAIEMLKQAKPSESDQVSWERRYRMCTQTYRVVAQGLCEQRAKAKASELNGVK